MVNRPIEFVYSFIRSSSKMNETPPKGCPICGAEGTEVSRSEPVIRNKKLVELVSKECNHGGFTAGWIEHDDSLTEMSPDDRGYVMSQAMKKLFREKPDKELGGTGPMPNPLDCGRHIDCTQKAERKRTRFMNQELFDELAERHDRAKKRQRAKKFQDKIQRMDD
jgi:hypothetical protein